MLDLAETICVLRQSRGWNQTKLGYLSGLSREYIKSIESGANKNPGMPKLIKIAEALNIPDHELFKAAGYIRESKGQYETTETPQQIIDRIRLDLRKLEKLLGEKED